MEEYDRSQQTFMQKAYASTCDAVSETAEYLASYSFGQSVLRQTDRVLWTVEKCAEWSIPNQPPPKHNAQNGTFGKPGPLVRPLPWILFIPMLFCLRVSRFFLNIASLLLGFESVKAMSMVKFIQVRRRKVRALKFLGLRRIRHRNQSKENIAKMSFRERFYNIMSRAMCFRVTNSDMYEEITVKKCDEDPQSSSSNTNRVVKQRSGKDLKRKYIEILKNNYYDWEDIEDDEELIDRITQLAEDHLEDEDEDPDFLPAEDSATEDDSMSDAEDETASSVTPPPNSSPKQLQRLSSHGSIANEIIEEESEDSDSTTVSANSADESSQALDKTPTPKKPEPKTNNDAKNTLEPSLTSDEYYSPMNSIPASPEPKVEPEQQSKVDPGTVKCINQNQNNTQTIQKDEKIEPITSDTKVKNSQNSLRPITAHETNNGSPGKANSNSHSLLSPRTKKHKNRRRFSNLLRRKRK